jgi:threonine aldolase
MNFASDNVTGVAPEIMDALAACNAETAAMPYGGDPWTARLQTVFSELFEREVIVYPVATGGAANALAASVISPSFGSIYCLEHSHLNADECGGPEFYTGGAKLEPLPDVGGKLTAAALDDKLSNRGPASGVHIVQPSAVSITQATEMGTVYSADEIGAVGEVARKHGLTLHMDGARFANAVAAGNASPADLTWRAGVDLLSFGATKNGAMAAEALILFDPALEAELGFRRKRGGHLFSKMRFLSAQLEAYVDDGLWLRLAGHANAMAGKLADGLRGIEGVEITHPVDANMIFARMPIALVERIQGAGFVFYHWGDALRPMTRLVTAFNTDPAHVDALLDAARA